MAKIQADFFKFIVTPLFETWHRFLDSPLSNQLVWNLHYNHCQWKKRVEREQDETIPVAGLVIPHSIDISSPHDNFDLSIPESLHESEVPITRYPHDVMDLETPTEELNPTTSVMSLSDQENVLRLTRVRVISHVETYFFKRAAENRKEEEKKKCTNGCCTPPECPQLIEDSPLITITAASTWCWHISRSLSEERTQQPSKDFDSPAHSWKGSANNLFLKRFNDRRGSAPMAIGRNHLQYQSDVIEINSGVRGGGRRWSVPSEPIYGAYNNLINKKHKDSQRNHNFLEPYVTITSEEPEMDAPNYTISKEKLEVDEKSLYVTGSPFILSCISSSSKSSKRRGSLPTDLPISLMQHSVRLDNPVKQVEHWDQKRRRSAGEILSVLLCPGGALTAMQNVDATSKNVGVYPRRGSDSLELLYSFWRSRRLEYKTFECAGFASKCKFPLPLDTSNIPEWSHKREDVRQFFTNYLFPTGQGGHSGISALNEHLCQRRASVPIGVSSLSVNSGSPYRNYQDRMS